MAQTGNSLRSLAGRLLFEMLLWIPVWMILTSIYMFNSPLLLLMGTGGLFLLGYVLAQLPAPWSRLLRVGVIVAIGISGLILYNPIFLVALWWCVSFWRGRYIYLSSGHYALASFISAAAVFVASNTTSVSGDRILFIGLSIGWLIVWFFSYNHSLIDEAALRGSLATRGVRRANRKYVIGFLVVGLCLFAATVSYGTQLLKPPYLKIELPDMSREEPPLQLDRAFPEMLEGDEVREPSIIGEILTKIVIIVAAIGLFFYIRMMWRASDWSWKSLIAAIRRWFTRERDTYDQLPYEEEIRSIAKDRKLGRWDKLFHKSNGERKWKELNDTEKVRRLYEEAVHRGMLHGFTFRKGNTPAETLAELDSWHLAKQAEGPAKGASYWNWYMSFREMLAMLYEKARYSPHEIEQQELKHLVKGHPEHDQL